MKTLSCHVLRPIAMIALLAGVQPASAVTIISTSPTNTASGIQPYAPIVFTFSAAMNPTNTTATFIDLHAGNSVGAAPVWSSGNTVLTCTPSPQFANGHAMEWSVSGSDTIGNLLTGTTTGTFTNIAGVNGGSGTNPFTLFLIGEYSIYNQTNTAPAVHLAYEFFPETLLASNRTATSVTVTLPSSAVSNLVESGTRPEQFSIAPISVNPAAFASNFPTGSYTFNVSGSSPQTTTVIYPSYVQPNAPQISNFTAAQSVNPAQPFTLQWNTFTNGTTADLIAFTVGLGNGLNYETPFFNEGGALNGTATSFTLPANILQPNTSYNPSLVFYHYTATTNGSTIVGSFLGTVTGFTLKTVGASASAQPTLNVSLSGANAVLSWPTNATGFRLEYTPTLISPSWGSNLPSPTIAGSNNVVSNALSGPTRFFRLISP